MKIYKPHEFAEKIGVSVRTLQRWDNEEKLKALRTPNGRRYYTQQHYDDYIKGNKISKVEIEIKGFNQVWEVEYIKARTEKIADATANGNYDSAIDMLQMIQEKARQAENLIKIENSKN